MFENYVLDSSAVDFSDNVIGEKSYVSSLLKETYEQKITRIRREIGELSLEEPSKSDSDELLTLLNRLSSNTALINHHPLHLEVEKRQDEVGESVYKSDHSQAVEMDARMSEIEKAIGIPDLLGETSDLSLQAELNNLHRQVNLLANPEWLKDISKKVEKMNLPDKVDIDEQKINLLYNRLTSLPRVDVSLPLALSRLKSLNSLHLQLDSSVGTLDDLEESFTSVNKEISDWKEALESTEQKLDKEKVDFEKNKAEIQNWIGDLKEKVESI